MLARESLIPADLVTFYDSIADVTWADVGNGYFLDPPRYVLLWIQEYGAVDVGQTGGLVIGSNGAGLSYVAGPDGTVYRTLTASLDEPELDKVADDLRQFLELPERRLGPRWAIRAHTAPAARTDFIDRSMPVGSPTHGPWRPGTAFT